jgi:hypothetical protein
MKKTSKINQHEFRKTDRQGNLCSRTEDASKLNKIMLILAFQKNLLYPFW